MSLKPFFQCQKHLRNFPWSLFKLLGQYVHPALKALGRTIDNSYRYKTKRSIVIKLSQLLDLLEPIQPIHHFIQPFCVICKEILLISLAHFLLLHYFQILHHPKQKEVLVLKVQNYWIYWSLFSQFTISCNAFVLFLKKVFYYHQHISCCFIIF